VHGKKILSFLLIFIFVLTACGSGDEGDEYTRYRASFIGLFDTHTVILGYTKTEEEFSYLTNIIREELVRLHELFDIYNEYDGINNMKTINLNAGIEPVEVDPVVISLLNLSKEAYYETDGLLNIALGSVLNIWHEYRTFGSRNPDLAELPSLEKLQHANNFTNINDIIIDEENNTVFLRYPEMSLDVGSLAKGYAVELVAQLANDIGLSSAVISIGGDIRTLDGPPVGTRDVWAIGIQDPDRSMNDIQNTIDTVYVTHQSVITSGDYQRFFVVDGQAYHHIINPRTLMPTSYYRSISVLYPNSATANMIAIAAFLLPLEESLQFVESLGAEAIWILNDASVVTTEGYSLVSRNFS